MSLPAPYRGRYWFFIALSAVGLITAWIFNEIASVNGADYLAA